jgi:sensor histidine kinase YesM
VRHGLEPSIDGGEITVAAERAGGMIRIKVIDSGVGIRETGGGSGIGLDNVRRRLAIVYGERANLRMEERMPKGIIVTIEVPDEAA